MTRLIVSCLIGVSVPKFCSFFKLHFSVNDVEDLKSLHNECQQIVETTSENSGENRMTTETWNFSVTTLRQVSKCALLRTLLVLLNFKMFTIKSFINEQAGQKDKRKQHQHMS